MVVERKARSNDHGTIPHGQRFLAGQIPMVTGSELDFTLNDHGEMSIFNFRGNVSWQPFQEDSFFQKIPQSEIPVLFNSIGRATDIFEMSRN